MDIIDEILKLNGQRVARFENIMYLLESLKNSFIGKVHMPHSYMIDNGVHAITFEAIYSNKKGQNADTPAAQMQRVKEAIGLIERMSRAFDQLDE